MSISYYILVFVVLMLILFCICQLEKYDFKRQNDKHLHTFKMDNEMFFIPSLINTFVVDNQIECTAKSLNKCNVNNTLSCSYCKEMTARCIHFDTDTKYKDPNTGEVAIIRKNANKDEGYCLQINTIKQACNPFHGELVLIKPYLNLNEYTYLCECFNPGFIGNLSYIGACETPFICNGKVEDINTSLVDMKCLCGAYEKSIIKDGIPLCVTLTVSEVTTLPYEDVPIPVRWLSADYRKYIKLEYVPDPCTRCLITNKPVNAKADMYYGENMNVIAYCVCLDENCLPVRRFDNHRYLSGDDGPDAVVYAELSNVIDYGFKNGRELFVAVYRPLYDPSLMEKSPLAIADLKYDFKWPMYYRNIMNLETTPFSKMKVCNLVQPAEIPALSALPTQIIWDITYCIGHEEFKCVCKPPAGLVSQCNVEKFTDYYINGNKIKLSAIPNADLDACVKGTTLTAADVKIARQFISDTLPTIIIDQDMRINSRLHEKTFFCSKVRAICLLYELDGFNQTVNLVRTTDDHSWEMYVDSLHSKFVLQ